MGGIGITGDVGHLWAQWFGGQAEMGAMAWGFSCRLQGPVVHHSREESSFHRGPLHLRSLLSLIIYCEVQIQGVECVLFGPGLNMPFRFMETGLQTRISQLVPRNDSVLLHNTESASLDTGSSLHLTLGLRAIPLPPRHSPCLDPISSL